MFTSLLDGSQINIAIALFAGFFTFFASCLLPLVPTYLAFLSGQNLNTDEAKEKRIILLQAAYFVLGFVFTFIFIGFVLNRFALLLGPYRIWLTRLSGLFFILMGSFMLGFAQKTLLQREFRFEIPVSWHRYRSLTSILTGMAFGFGWTPCIGPVLAVILYWSTQQATAFQGLLLLTSFGVGLGIPFLLIGAAFERIYPLLQRSQSLTRWIQTISGIFILVTGILMTLNQFQFLSLQLMHFLQLPIFTL